LGSAATDKQLENWRGDGLLPAPIQRPTYADDGRVSGSTVWHSPIEAGCALAIERALDNGKRLHAAGAILWLAGAPVDEKYWRPRFDQAGASLLTVRRGLRLLTRESTDTFGERVTIPLAELNGVFAKMARRIPKQQAATGIDLVVSVASGQFDGFTNRDPDEGDLKDSDVAERALDLSAAKSDQIGGAHLNFSGLGAMLAEIAASIDTYSLDAFSDAEIAQARDDVRNGFKLAVCFHAAMSWIYGPQAFGLRTISWMGRHASLNIWFASILLFAQLRRRSDQLLPSSQIAALAHQAEAAWFIAIYFRGLQSIPQLANAIDQKHWKSAFEDSHRMADLIKELAGYEFPWPAFRPWDQWKQLSAKTMPTGLLAMSIGAANQVDPGAILHVARGAPNP